MANPKDAVCLPVTCCHLGFSGDIWRASWLKDAVQRLCALLWQRLQFIIESDIWWNGMEVFVAIWALLDELFLHMFVQSLQLIAQAQTESKQSSSTLKLDNTSHTSPLFWSVGMTVRQVDIGGLTTMFDLNGLLGFMSMLSLARQPHEGLVSRFQWFWMFGFTVLLCLSDLLSTNLRPWGDMMHTLTGVRLTMHVSGVNHTWVDLS